ncbi:adenylate kinase 7-like [Homalodisca vitripennis]|uniref:adenylate kinase 7-like n=1 Tax=Homalodisca vitripennis TaxID=197043 RepID=UPI001EEB0991|nr:adenylate kinase 7-like [Homalodisca vitripennis]
MKSDKKKSVSPPKESILPLSENSVDLRYSVFDEKIAYDTSKLTIAEYFEMMDLEDGEPRDEYLKEKLDEFKVIIPPLNQHSEKILKTKVYKRNLKLAILSLLGHYKMKSFQMTLYKKEFTEIINASRENLSFIKDVAKCGVIIYNILDDSEQAVEASWVLNSLSYFMQELKEDGEISKFTPPLFILLSTFMTWSLSKSLHPKIPDLPFSEKDYRKRTPHPNYQMHYELEEEVIRVKSSGEIDAVILTCGIPYGHEESVFSYFFETAVNCNVDVPVYYGSGQNFFPVIHVENIGEIVREVIKKSEKITLPFLFAKDPISFYKKDVIKAITRGFGAECYKIMPEEFSFFGRCYHLVTPKLKKTLPLRGLLFFGSSLQDMENLPQRLSQYYNSLYLSPDVAVQDYVSKMLDKITKFEEQKHTEDATQQRIGLELEGDPVKVPDLKNRSNGRTFILYERMKSRVCLIHGYVLDDFPKTLEEAQSLFSTDDRYTFQSNDSSGHPHLPDYVVYLNQVEDAIPESAVTGDNAYRYSKEGPSFTPDNTVKVLSQDDIQPVNIESKTDTKIENTVEGMIEEQK